MIYVKFIQHKSETCNGRDVTLFTLDHEDSGLKYLSNCAILVLVISFSQLTRTDQLRHRYTSTQLQHAELQYINS